MAWLKQQLQDTSSRKFILTNHIYPGAKYTSDPKNLFMSDLNQQFFALLLQFKDKIVIEVSAHDHFSDLRYHSNGDDSNKQFYHNLLVAPGISPIKNQNPGLALFEIEPTTLVPRDLKMLFLNV